MTKTISKPSTTKRSGVDQDQHHCYSDVSDAKFWADESLDLVFDLDSYRDGKTVRSGAWLQFSDGGENSHLSVWDGERFVGFIDGADLLNLLTRALHRAATYTPENSPSLSILKTNGLTLIRGGRRK